MNVVFISPHFPQNYYLFCARLRAFGVKVLGIADQPLDSLRPELRSVLSDYYQVTDLHRYDELVRAIGYFTYRHGRIDRIDSLNEHWLESEARLRSDFNVFGFKAEDLPRIKRKSEMKQGFVAAGVEVAPGIVANDAAAVRDFAERVGFPLVAKPDSGVGASSTFSIHDQAGLERFLETPRNDYFLEAYIDGTIQTFDGLTDQRGEPVFYTSMEYNRGVMEVVNYNEDVFYYTQREIPADIEAAGRAILREFNVRERFFHFEFFRTRDGRLLALEVNMRPPGGWSIDMFNYANDIDLYREWAHLLAHGDFAAGWSAPYFVCYAARKYGKWYKHSHEEVLSRFAHQIVFHQPMPALFSRAMGDYGYLFRSPRREEILEIAGFIQEHAN